MILSFSSVEKTDLSKSSNFLFYGENQGRIEECTSITIESIKKDHGNVNFIYLSSDELKKGNFRKLIFDSDNNDLFGNKNILIVSMQDQKAAKEIVDTLNEKNQSTVKLIIKSTQLKKNTTLRNFFEKSKNNLIIPCYEETENDKKNIIKKVFNSEKLNISNEEIELLSSLLGNERLEIKNELNKLIIFIKNSKKDIRGSANIISGHINENISQLIFFLSSKKKKDFLRNFFNSKDIQNDEIRLINYLSDHFMKILEVKNKIRSGYEKNFAIKSLRPPIFFKYITEFSKQVDLWSDKEIDFFLRKLFQCQSSSLKNSRSSKFQLYFLFLRILNFGNKH